MKKIKHKATFFLGLICIGHCKYVRSWVATLVHEDAGLLLWEAQEHGNEK